MAKTVLPGSGKKVGMQKISDFSVVEEGVQGLISGTEVALISDVAVVVVVKSGSEEVSCRKTPRDQAS